MLGTNLRHLATVVVSLLGSVHAAPLTLYVPSARSSMSPLLIYIIAASASAASLSITTTTKFVV